MTKGTHSGLRDGNRKAKAAPSKEQLQSLAEKAAAQLPQEISRRAERARAESQRKAASLDAKGRTQSLTFHAHEPGLFVARWKTGKAEVFKADKPFDGQWGYRVYSRGKLVDCGHTPSRTYAEHAVAALIPKRLV